MNNIWEELEVETLEGMLEIAYETTQLLSNSRVEMFKNHATNQSKFVQAFKGRVIPSNNKVPKKSKNGGTIVSSAAGYKELIVWVYFGNNTDWYEKCELRWLYMDRSIGWADEQLSGGIDEIDQLRKISRELLKEEMRIEHLEEEYREKNGNLDGLVIEGYGIVE